MRTRERKGGPTMDNDKRLELSYAIGGLTAMQEVAEDSTYEMLDIAIKALRELLDDDLQAQNSQRRTNDVQAR